MINKGLKIIRKKRHTKPIDNWDSGNSKPINNKVSESAVKEHNKPVFDNEYGTFIKNMYLPESGDIENVDYLNINKSSLKNSLGNKLSPGYPEVFQTIFGKVGNMSNFLDFIITPDYDMKMLPKTSLTTTEIKKNSSRKTILPHYWSVVAYGIASRIKSNPALMEELKLLPKSIKVTSFEVIKEGIYTSYIPKDKALKYCSILKDIILLLKEDKNLIPLEFSRRYISRKLTSGDNVKIDIFEGITGIKLIKN